jgi:hypothetical protein
VEQQLEDAWGALNDVLRWINRHGVTVERRADGTFNYVGALSEVLRQAREPSR